VDMQDVPYYSELESVYHTRRDCPQGRRIPPELRKAGTGGRVLCAACQARLEGATRVVEWADRQRIDNRWRMDR
jgi:hypothetical protein